MGKHSDFRISSFQVEGAWRILQFNRKTQKYLKKSLYGFEGRCHKITDVCMDQCFKSHNLIPVQP